MAFTFLWFGILGVLFFWGGFRTLKKKRLIENTPTSKIRSLAMGLVEIYGTVIPKKKTLTSPLTSKDCVYYDYKVQEYRKRGKRSSWVTIRSGTDMTPFELKDETSSVLVDPIGAEVSIPEDFTFESGLLRKDPPNNIKDFLRKNNLTYEGLLGINKQMRFAESYITQKDKLFILGTAGDNPNVKEATSKKNVEDIMIQKGSNNIYFISDKQEKEVLKKLSLMSVGGIILGSVFILISISTLIFSYL